LFSSNIGQYTFYNTGSPKPIGEVSAVSNVNSPSIKLLPEVEVDPMDINYPQENQLMSPILSPIPQDESSTKRDINYALYSDLD